LAQRVQRDAPEPPRRGVSEAVGHEGVRELMDGDRDQERRELKEKAPEKDRRVAEEICHSRMREGSVVGRQVFRQWITGHPIAFVEPPAKID
jgi:hypothetical protein